VLFDLNYVECVVVDIMDKFDDVFMWNCLITRWPIKLWC